MTGRVYDEHFDQSPGGWWGWVSNAGGPKPLEHRDSTITSRSPWWIDYNHAPPGAGYLHMVFCMLTKGPTAEYYREVGGVNTFVDDKFPRDFTSAQITVRLKGELELRGAQLVLLVQSTIGAMTSAWLLTSDPLRVTPDWTEQTITCVADESKWTCMKGRHDRADYYGYLPLKDVLCDVNCDIMFVLFPLTIAPMGPLEGDPHILRPEKDYPVWRSKLPEGYVTIDRIRIAFP